MFHFFKIVSLGQRQIVPPEDGFCLLPLHSACILHAKLCSAGQAASRKEREQGSGTTETSLKSPQRKVWKVMQSRGNFKTLFQSAWEHPAKTKISWISTAPTKPPPLRTHWRVVNAHFHTLRDLRFGSLKSTKKPPDRQLDMKFSKYEPTQKESICNSVCLALQRSSTRCTAEAPTKPAPPNTQNHSHRWNSMVNVRKMMNPKWQIPYKNWSKVDAKFALGKPTGGFWYYSVLPKTPPLNPSAHPRPQRSRAPEEAWSFASWE